MDKHQGNIYQSVLIKYYICHSKKFLFPKAAGEVKTNSMLLALRLVGEMERLSALAAIQEQNSLELCGW